MPFILVRRVWAGSPLHVLLQRFAAVVSNMEVDGIHPLVWTTQIPAVAGENEDANGLADISRPFLSDQTGFSSDC